MMYNKRINDYQQAAEQDRHRAEIAEAEFERLRSESEAEIEKLRKEIEAIRAGKEP